MGRGWMLGFNKNPRFPNVLAVQTIVINNGIGHSSTHLATQPKAGLS
jgi:hypothetical protein